MQNKNNKINANKPVVIVGGGWSGLTCAVRLCAQNIPVILLESARHAGGRARNVNFDDRNLDNGQHLMIGAYTSMLSLYRQLGIKEKTVFERLPQHIKITRATNDRPETVINLKLPRLAKPFNLLFGTLSCSGLNFKEKLQSLFNFDKLLKIPFTAESDTHVNDWIYSEKLPENFITFLQALCIAALNTPAEIASARSFQNVLNQTFNGQPGSTDLLFARGNLDEIFIQHAIAFIEKHNGKVLTEHRALKLESENNRHVTHVITDHAAFEASAVILTTPPNITSKLLVDLPACDVLQYELTEFDYEPICTVYLQYDETIEIPEIMLGLDKTFSQWLFDRRVSGQDNLISVVISAGGDHMALNKAQLIEQVIKEVHQAFPYWPQPTRSWLIREKRATIACTPASNRIRPATITPINNLFLAGDFVVNDDLFLPATLETTIRNADFAVKEVINYLTS